MKLTLYRGDSSKIKEFELKKTYKYCLLGQGIYLTDSIKIAQTYRTKGSGEIAIHQLFYGEAANRNDAIEKAFGRFCERLWFKEHGWRPRYPTGIEAKKYEEKHRAQYDRLVEEKVIVAEYASAPVPVYSSSPYRGVGGAIAMRKDMEKRHKRYLKVEWEENPNAGYMTRFEFDPQQFNPNVFNVDKACNDEFFWTLMYDHDVRIGQDAEGLEGYIRANRGRRVFDAVSSYEQKRSAAETWMKIARILKPYGYIGYEYNGGLRLGGKIHHRAFSIWDENFVNDHKVERFK